MLVPIDIPHDVAGPERTVARDRQLGPTRDDPAYGRAALEVAAVLGIGVAQYWANAGTNSRDWDFPHWTDRLSLEGVRFDNDEQAGAQRDLVRAADDAADLGHAAVTALNTAAAEFHLFSRKRIYFTEVAG
jgi:hypothetical protein